MNIVKDRHSSDKRSAGFTLVEVLVVLAVISVAGVIIWQQVPSNGDRARLETASALIRRSIIDARSAAMLSGRSTRLIFDSSRRIVSIDQIGATEVALPNVLMSLTTAVEAEAIRGASPSILFMPDGSNSGAVIDLESGRARRNLSLSWLTGRVLEVVISK